MTIIAASSSILQDSSPTFKQTQAVDEAGIRQCRIESNPSLLSAEYISLLSIKIRNMVYAGKFLPRHNKDANAV
jgi:hypothetical protein